MIDSTDAAVMERALTYCQGKSILNSINLEDGAERFEKVVPLARRFGAALVVGLHRREGAWRSPSSASSRWRERSYQILTEDMGIARRGHLVGRRWSSPAAPATRTTSARRAQTIEGGARAQGRSCPRTKTILGISNVSFGLPTAGREVLNSVFLYHCTQAGLDAAIVNTERLARYAEIPEEERAARRGAALPAARRRRGRRPRRSTPSPRTSAAARRPPRRAPRARLAARRAPGARRGRGLEGRPRSTTSTLALADPRWPQPLDIINGPLMTGMDEVGRLFNDNELIVAEVLQSAEVMKAAVSYLEPHMEKAEGVAARQGAARHGQGRRPRHRQEPGRHHPLQQRLRGGEPGHQGAVRAADPGGARAQAGRASASRACWSRARSRWWSTAGDLKAVGIDVAAPGRRRRAVAPLHAPQDRPRLRRRSAPTPRTP